ncbi:unnamed protein product [Kluyveromyces dobzhanskii CBS 2104]|uniref:WGS project CCBQ000000000 data, contig 00104 n=1 Tax=Kluyveromyces dobzhanskii CBS 2104 TaxID=1427455 RepID=A0A0A8L5Y4_9SACH|nr:unnamed protein product [Kluyveromyces dobzhanskii CBS 2104]
MLSRTVTGLFSLGRLVGARNFHASASQLQKSTQGSLFGEVTEDINLLKDDDPNKLSNKLTTATELSDDMDASTQLAEAKKKITAANDTQLQKYIEEQNPVIKSLPEFLLPRAKREFYESQVKLNGGFFDKTVRPKDRSLRLTNEELEVLEPSVYIKSYRVKSSMKKVTQLLRLLNGLDAKKALTQCHFSDKKVAREVAELLERGIADGSKLGLAPNDLYISQIWTGSDGQWQKRVEWKGRGRRGIIEHPYVHIKCILKTKSVTKRRLEHEAKLKEQKKKPWVQLADKPIRGSMGGVYKW